MSSPLQHTWSGMIPPFEYKEYGDRYPYSQEVQAMIRGQKNHQANIDRELLRITRKYHFDERPDFKPDLGELPYLRIVRDQE